MLKPTAAMAFLALSAPLYAQNAPPSDFTTPKGAAFIHQSIKEQLLSFKEDGNQDYIYFTAIIGWRCGVQDLYYGLNDQQPVTRFPLEPCNRDLRQPNTSKFTNLTYPFFITVPKGSAQKVTLRVIYEDGSTAIFESERAKNMIL